MMSRNRKARQAARQLKAAGIAATIPEAHRILRHTAMTRPDRATRFTEAERAAAESAGITLPSRPFTAHLGVGYDGSDVDLDLAASPIIPIVGMVGAGKTRLAALMLAPLVGRYQISAYGRGVQATDDPRSAPLGRLLESGDAMPLDDRITAIEDGRAGRGDARPQALLIDDPETALLGDPRTLKRLVAVASPSPAAPSSIAAILICVSSVEAVRALYQLVQNAGALITVGANPPGILAPTLPGRIEPMASRTGRATLAGPQSEPVEFEVPDIDLGALGRFTAALRNEHTK